MKILNLIIVLSALAFIEATGSSYANDVSYNMNYDDYSLVRINGIGRIPYQEIVTIIGNEGQSQDEFARSISHVLTDFSEKTGFEACGYIATDGEKYGIVITTSRSHLACVNYARAAPDGMIALNDTIHSHSPITRARPNAADKVLMGNEMSARGGGMRQPTSVLRGQLVDMFSDMDIKSGPGYLAVPHGKVIHQNGSENSVRYVE